MRGSKRRPLRVVARPKVDLSAADWRQLRDAWAEYRRANAEAEASSKRLLALVRRFARRYSQAAVARALGVSPQAVNARLRKTNYK